MIRIIEPMSKTRMEGTSKFKAQVATEALKEREILTEPVSNEKRIRRLIRIKSREPSFSQAKPQQAQGCQAYPSLFIEGRGSDSSEPGAGDRHHIHSDIKRLHVTDGDH
jgi:hypothetical protein